MGPLPSVPAAPSPGSPPGPLDPHHTGYEISHFLQVSPGEPTHTKALVSNADFTNCSWGTGLWPHFCPFLPEAWMSTWDLALAPCPLSCPGHLRGRGQDPTQCPTSLPGSSIHSQGPPDPHWRLHQQTPLCPLTTDSTCGQTLQIRLCVLHSMLQCFSFTSDSTKKYRVWLFVQKQISPMGSVSEGGPLSVSSQTITQQVLVN